MEGCHEHLWQALRRDFLVKVPARKGNRSCESLRGCALALTPLGREREQHNLLPDLMSVYRQRYGLRSNFGHKKGNLYGHLARGRRRLHSTRIERGDLVQVCSHFNRDMKPPGHRRIIEEEYQPKLLQGRQRAEHELFTVSNAVENRSYTSVRRTFYSRGQSHVRKGHYDVLLYHRSSAPLR